MVQRFIGKTLSYQQGKKHLECDENETKLLSSSASSFLLRIWALYYIFSRIWGALTAGPEKRAVSVQEAKGCPLCSPLLASGSRLTFLCCSLYCLVPLDRMLTMRKHSVNMCGFLDVYQGARWVVKTTISDTLGQETELLW